MQQIFGNYLEPKSANQEYLKIGFSPSSLSLQQRWRNNGLSADFLADYLSTFFPGDDSVAQYKQAEIRDAVSYIANELLENAMKFNYALDKYPVSITLQLAQDSICFYVQNSIDPQLVAPFQALIKRLLNEDPDELYMEKLMSNAEEHTSDASGLGFLTMLTSYHTQLAWKFETPATDTNMIIVNTMVYLPL